MARMESRGLWVGAARETGDLGRVRPMLDKLPKDLAKKITPARMEPKPGSEEMKGAPERR